MYEIRYWSDGFQEYKSDRLFKTEEEAQEEVIWLAAHFAYRITIHRV